MDVIVVGGGIIGLSTAWYLQKVGYQVKVIEAGADVALEASFANAGMLTPGYAGPWATPGILRELYGLMKSPFKPLSIEWDHTLFQLVWLWRLYRYSRADYYEKNRLAMHQLAQDNLTLLGELRKETDIKYSGRAQGTLQLYRSQNHLIIVGITSIITERKRLLSSSWNRIVTMENMSQEWMQRQLLGLSA